MIKERTNFHFHFFFFFFKLSPLAFSWNLPNFPIRLFQKKTIQTQSRSQNLLTFLTFKTPNFLKSNFNQNQSSINQSLISEEKPKMFRRSRPPKDPLQWRFFVFFFLFSLSHLLHSSNGDVGTASKYPPPYSPTACFGGDLSQFPTSNLFAAAGDGIWENGAACGRQYFVRCFSASEPEACVPDQTVQITIVDYAPEIVSAPTAAGTTMILSTTAYNAIVNISSIVNFVTIEFQQV